MFHQQVIHTKFGSSAAMSLKLTQRSQHHHKTSVLSMDITAVEAKLATLKTSVEALIALPSNPPPVDLQPLGDAVDAIQADVNAKLTPAST